MATFFIEQFGCRATQADAAAIERQLRSRGFDSAPAVAAADVVIVNTCTVTAAADSQARRAIRAIHRANPDARIIATGCYAQRAPEDLAALPGVAFVVGNSHKPEIPRLAEIGAAIDAGESSPAPFAPGRAAFVPLASLALPGGAPSTVPAPHRARILVGDVSTLTDVLVAPVEGGEAQHTRPILKIQDGCNHRCAFCVIPHVRGNSRSLSPARVVDELNALVARGYREIVLSGIHLGSYGRDLVPRADLLGLLRLILDETRLERLRLSSIEPMDVTEGLVALVASTPRIARHFHVPLQSASNRILAAMHRWYRAEHYARRLEWISAWLPEAAIGADVIAGFPDETEEDHRATLDFVRAQPFTYLHVFSFSPRPGTPAAALPGQVAPREILRRARELRALAAEKKAAFLARHVGATLSVLTLRPSPRDAASGVTPAVSSNNIEVQLPGVWPANRMIEVRAVAATPSGLAAEPCVSADAPVPVRCA
ncbi:MAG: tRNA (N(6)-L-threonylcarbamoyladenosine(37)-C(2))-methylthiotransferase MtaB [Candidatus Acidiferrales bacterium]